MATTAAAAASPAGPTAVPRAPPATATAAVRAAEVAAGSRRALGGVWGCRQAQSSWKVIGFMARTLANWVRKSAMYSMEATWSDCLTG